MPIPEVAVERGFKCAERVDANVLVGKLNADVERELGYKEVVGSMQVPQIFLNRKVFSPLSNGQKKAVLARLKDVLLAEPAIKSCWTKSELESFDGSADSDKFLFSKQTFCGRTGDLTFLTHPYKMVTSYPSGTSHATPYRYDVHVPMCFTQKLRLNKKDIREPVSMIDFASTMACLMGIPMPSASTGQCLPVLG
jgi:hypothetical protein